MLMTSVIVENIDMHDGIARATGSLFEFGHGGRWISVNDREAHGTRIGPVMIVGESEERDWPAGGEHIHVTQFGGRDLHTAADSETIYYQEHWTPPEGGACLFCLVVPHGFASDAWDTHGRDTGGWIQGQTMVQYPHGIALSPEGRLFGYLVIYGPVLIQLRLMRDDKRVAKIVETIDVAEGESKIERAASHLPGPVRTPDFWWRLFEFGTKLMGG